MSEETPSDWHPISRLPAAYRPIEVETEDGKRYSMLCYCPKRGEVGEIFEPKTNRAAEPVIGAIKRWRYD